MAKHLILWTVLTLAFSALSGCMSGAETGRTAADSIAQTENPPGDDSEQEEEGPAEFVFATLSGGLSLDPVHAYTSLESQIYTAIYEGLFTYDHRTLDPIPAAAQSYEVSEDGRTYTFFLRPDGRWSNGDPVTARDFYDSWFRMLDPDAGADYSTFYDIIVGARDYRTGKTSDRDEVGIRVKDSLVLEVELEQTAPHFLRVLCHMSFVPIHSEYHDEADWESRTTIIGNGPFFILENSDSEIVLARNNLYWDREVVELDRIVMRFLGSAGAASEAFNQGLVHWATNWDSSALDDTSKIVLNPLFSTNFFFIKSDRPPWNDERVRRALALLIPWAEIRGDQVLFPTGRLVPQIPGYPDVEMITEPDTEQAMELLEAAGFAEGKGLPPIRFRIPQGGDSQRIAGLMGDAWKEALGLEVEYDLVSYTVYFDRLKTTGYDVGQMTWIGDFTDPLTFLQMWTTDSNLNDAAYSGSEYDALVSEGTSIADMTERYDRFSKAESIILRDAVILPISHQPSFNLLDVEHVDGWFPNPLDIHPFKNIRFRGPRVIPNIVMR